MSAPPYDVIDDDERLAFERLDPTNSVRLILPTDGEQAGDRYDRAASTMQGWLADGILEADAEPLDQLAEQPSGGRADVALAEVALGQLEQKVAPVNQVAEKLPTDHVSPV